MGNYETMNTVEDVTRLNDAALIAEYEDVAENDPTSSRYDELENEIVRRFCEYHRD